jgi:hypothetical protein
MKQAALAVCLAAVGLLYGCNRNQPAAPVDSKYARVDQIIKTSGGDWNKVSPEDRDFLIRDIGKGSPISAQMTFNARAGGLRPGAGIHH